MMELTDKSIRSIKRLTFHYSLLLSKIRPVMAAPGSKGYSRRQSLTTQNDMTAIPSSVRHRVKPKKLSLPA